MRFTGQLTKMSRAGWWIDADLPLTGDAFVTAGELSRAGIMRPHVGWRVTFAVWVRDGVQVAADVEPEDGEERYTTPHRAPPRASI